MISVFHLTKHYRGCTAVDDLSFEVGRGEVVGFVGPNGAGKTTTMRVLAGFLAATGGDVQVAGYDVRTQSKEVRRRIGYLPESVPLYDEMRVDEYLRYRARIKRLPVRRLRSRVAEVKERCGLLDVGRTLIGRLSRGYRQRVGLADALVHDPELLILDEPTLGLDPDQNRQVRNLIGDLRDRHTILLSTHILPEVERTCNRLLVIRQGRIVAAGAPAELRASLGGGARLQAQIKGAYADVQEQLGVLPHVLSVDVQRDDPWLTCTIESVRDVDLRTNVFELAVRHGWGLRELRMLDHSLEDVYLSLTTKPTPEIQP